MAAPFVTGSYKVKFYSTRHIQLTAEDRAQIIATWGEDTDPDIDKACDDKVKVTDRSSLRVSVQCTRERWALRNSYRIEEYRSLSKYVAFNGAIMLATLTIMFFALTAAMAAARKWVVLERAGWW
jgi:hypothetical protein